MLIQTRGSDLKIHSHFWIHFKQMNFFITFFLFLVNLPTKQHSFPSLFAIANTKLLSVCPCEMWNVNLEVHIDVKHGKYVQKSNFTFYYTRLCWKKNRYHISGINMFALKSTISSQSKKKDNNSIKVICLRRWLTKQKQNMATKYVLCLYTLKPWK